MDEYIKNSMLDGEKIIWTGRPQKVKLLEKPFQNSIFARWAVGAAILIFSVWYSSYAVEMAIEGDRVRNFVIILIAIAAVIALGPLWTVRKLQSKCIYCITNQRAIIFFAVNPIKMKFRMLEDVSSVSYEDLPNGCGTVYIGEKTDKARKMSRLQSTNANIPDQDLPLIFYSVDSPAEVCRHITKRQDKIAG